MYFFNSDRQWKYPEDAMSVLTNVFPPTSQVKAWERKDLPCLTACCHLYKVRSEGVKGIISCVAAEAALLSATCYLLPLITVRWLAMVGVSTSLTWLSLVLSHSACRSYSQGEKWSRFLPAASLMLRCWKCLRSFSWTGEFTGWEEDAGALK